MSKHTKYHIDRLNELLTTRARNATAEEVESARTTFMDLFWFRFDDVERVMRRIAPLVTIHRPESGRPEVMWNGARLQGNGRFTPFVGAGGGPVPGDMEDALDRFINAVLELLKGGKQPGSG